MAKATMPNQAAFVATGGLIATYVAGEVQHPLAQRLVALARTPGVPIEPVIAYRSYKEFQHEQSVKKVKFDPTAERPYAMFGWEFFVPEDSDKTDWQLLREACQLASRDDFRESRQSFHYWLKHMHEGNVDPETARDDMLKRLREYRDDHTWFKNEDHSTLRRQSSTCVGTASSPGVTGDLCHWR